MGHGMGHLQYFFKKSKEEKDLLKKKVLWLISSLHTDCRSRIWSFDWAAASMGPILSHLSVVSFGMVEISLVPLYGFRSHVYILFICRMSWWWCPSDFQWKACFGLSAVPCWLAVFLKYYSAAIIYSQANILWGHLWGGDQAAIKMAMEDLWWSWIIC